MYSEVCGVYFERKKKHINSSTMTRCKTSDSNAMENKRTLLSGQFTLVYHKVEAIHKFQDV